MYNYIEIKKKNLPHYLMSEGGRKIGGTVTMSSFTNTYIKLIQYYYCEYCLTFTTSLCRVRTKEIIVDD